MTRLRAGAVLTLRALVTLWAVRAKLRSGDFMRIRRMLATPDAASPSPPDGRIVEICRAVNRACGLALDPQMCLRRAIVATVMLRRCGVPAQLVLGVTPLGLRGHAWVEVNGEVVNDPYFSRDDYTVVDRF